MGGILPGDNSYEKVHFQFFSSSIVFTRRCSGGVQLHEVGYRIDFFDMSKYFISNFRYTRYRNTLYRTFGMLSFPIYQITFYRTFDMSNYFLSNFRYHGMSYYLISNFRYIELLYIEFSIYRIELVLPSIVSLGIHPRVFNDDIERKFESHQNVEVVFCGYRYDRYPISILISNTNYSTSELVSWSFPSKC